MASNNVDILVRLKTQVLGLAGTLGGIASLKALIDNIIEAQAATAQLDNAFRATGRGLGLTHQRLDDLASSLQETTVVSDDLVKKAESILLTFTKVRGDAFERTIKSATDLSARLGVDLVSATRLLGKALQDPERGLTQLRKSGVSFNETQTELIKKFIDTGQTAKAQAVILGEVEKRFKGSAEAARNTLGGALEGLKNSFGDLFEGTQKGTSSAVGAVNNLSKAFNDPKLKESIDGLVELIAKLSAIVLTSITASVKPVKDFSEALKELGIDKGLGTVVDLLGKLSERATNLSAEPLRALTMFAKKAKQVADAAETLRINNAISLTQRRIANPTILTDVEAENRKLAALLSERDRLQGRGGPARRFKRREDPGEAVIPEDEENAAEELTEIVITQRKIQTDANKAFFDDLDEATKTSTENQLTEYAKTRQGLLELRDAGLITKEVFDARSDEAVDKLLPEIDTQAIHAQLKTVAAQAEETSAIIRGAFEQAGASIQSTLSEAIQSGKLSFKSLVDVARKAVADILAAIIVSGIKKAIASQLATGGSGGKASVFGSILGAFLGKKAAGGRGSGPTLVGEEGPELVNLGAGSQVFNKRQLQFMGKGEGSGAVYAPQTNVQIIERENPEQTKREILQLMALTNARNEERFIARLGKNGVLIR